MRNALRTSFIVGYTIPLVFLGFYSLYVYWIISFLSYNIILIFLFLSCKIAIYSAERIKMTWLFQFSLYLASKYKTSDVFRRTFFVGRLSFSSTSRKRSKLVWPFNYSLTIQVCVANIPLNYYHRHFHLNIGKGLSGFDWVWTALWSILVFL